MTFDLDMVIKAAWLLAVVVWLMGSFTNKATARRQSLGSRLLEIAPLLLGVLLLRTDRTLFRLLMVRFVPDTNFWTGG